MKSLAELNEAIEREPDNPEHYDRLAAAYDDAENYEAALRDVNHSPLKILTKPSGSPL